MDKRWSVQHGIDTCVVFNSGGMLVPRQDGSLHRQRAVRRLETDKPVRDFVETNNLQQ